MPFEKWLAIDAFKDYQTKALAGTANVSEAIEIIERRVWLVGIREAFDEFLLMLRKKLAIRDFDIRYKARRVASERQARNDARQIDWANYGDAIYENNRNDFELYNYVNRVILPRQRNWYGREMERDVAEFRKELLAYSPNRVRESACYLYRNLYSRPLRRLAVRLTRETLRRHK